jgi:hypothetical protein
MWGKIMGDRIWLTGLFAKRGLFELAREKGATGDKSLCTECWKTSNYSIAIAEHAQQA